jgi:hypothetical protein
MKLGHRHFWKEPKQSAMYWARAHYHPADSLPSCFPGGGCERGQARADYHPADPPFIVFQTLEVSENGLRHLPDELSSLGRLASLTLDRNCFLEVPISALSGMTALEQVDFSNQSPPTRNTHFKVTSPLLPVLHPGLICFALYQRRRWDQISLFHIGRAFVEVADRKLVPSLLF